VLQSIPVLHRDCEVLDWVTDTIAIVVVLILVAMIRARRRRTGAAQGIRAPK
jgi:hypothetical protein